MQAFKSHICINPALKTWNSLLSDRVSGENDCN